MGDETGDVQPESQSTERSINLGNPEILHAPEREELTPLSKLATDIAKEMMQTNLDITPVQNSGEVEQCATPPFGPLPPLLAQSPRAGKSVVSKQTETRQIKSIIIAQELKPPDQLDDSKSGNASKSSPSSSKLKKKVKKKRY